MNKFFSLVFITCCHYGCNNAQQAPFSWSKIEEKMQSDDKKSFLKNIDEGIIKSANAISKEMNSNNVFKSFHLIDLNGDGYLDVVFNGYAGASDELIIVFISEKGRYKKVLDAYGHVSNAKIMEGGSEITVTLNEDTESSETINYRIVGFEIKQIAL